MLSLGCKWPLLKHVICHRRQVLMVLRENQDLNVSFSFKVDGFTCMVFATSNTMKCFSCGAEGHLIRACPERAETVPSVCKDTQVAPVMPRLL